MSDGAVFEMSEDWKAQLRADLERAGERAVRDDMNNRGGLTTGGEERLRIIREWLREKDLAREAAEQSATALTERTLAFTERTFALTEQTFTYTRRTCYAAVAALVATVIGIIIALLHL